MEVNVTRNHYRLAFGFLQQRVGDEKLEKQRLQDLYDMQ